MQAIHIAMRVLVLSLSPDSATVVRLRRALDPLSMGTSVEVCTTPLQLRQRLGTGQPCQAIVVDDRAIASALPVLVRHLRTEAPGVRIILLTEAETEGTLARGVLAGADYVLPCVDEGLDRIRAALTERLKQAVPEAPPLKVHVWGAGRHLLAKLEKSNRLFATLVSGDQAGVDQEKWLAADALLLVATVPEEAAVLLHRVHAKMGMLPVIALADERSWDGLLRLGASDCLPLESSLSQLEDAVGRASQIHRLRMDNAVLRAKEGRLRFDRGVVPGGVLLTGPDGTIQAINHAAVTLCKARGSSSVLGRRLPDIFGAASRERIATLVAEVAGGSQASLDLDLEQGEGVPRLQLRAVPFSREEGQPPCILLTIGDVRVAPQSDHVATLAEQVAGLTERVEQERAARTAAEQEHAHARELSLAAATEWQVRAEDLEKALRTLEQERSALEVRLAAAKTSIAEAERLQDSTRANVQALDQLAAEIAQRERALEEARSAIDDTRRSQEHTECQLDAARSETHAVRTLLSEVEHERAVLQHEIAERARALDDVSRELHSLRAIQAQGEHAREELQVELGRREEALVLAIRQLEELREAHAEELRAAHAETVRATQTEAAGVDRSRLEAGLVRLTEAVQEGSHDPDALRQAHAADCAAFLKEKRSQPSLAREIGVLRAHLDDPRVSVERANAEAEQASLARDDWRHCADVAIERTAREELEWQRRAEAAIECRPSEELEWTLGVARVGLVTTDAGGVIERCNDAAARLCGCSDADALLARDRLPHALFDAGMVAGEVGPTRRFETWVQGLDGLLRLVLGVVTPRKDAASSHEHLEWVLVDLDGHCIQERSARVILGMETLTHFLSSATTECTTLLGQVGETVDSLFAGAPAGMPEERIDETRKALMRTRFVLQQLASSARNGERCPVVIDLAQALDQASPLLARLAGKDTPCEVVRPGLTLPVVADPADLDQLLTAIGPVGTRVPARRRSHDAVRAPPPRRSQPARPDRRPAESGADVVCVRLRSAARRLAAGLGPRRAPWRPHRDAIRCEGAPLDD